MQRLTFSFLHTHWSTLAAEVNNRMNTVNPGSSQVSFQCPAQMRHTAEHDDSIVEKKGERRQNSWGDLNPDLVTSIG